MIGKTVLSFLSVENQICGGNSGNRRLDMFFLKTETLHLGTGVFHLDLVFRNIKKL